MWYSDRAPASKPRQDIRSCWSGTLAMQHPDLKCSSGFVVICSSQLSQYRGALQERPLSSSSGSHLSLHPLSLNQSKLSNQPTHLCPSLFCLLLQCVDLWVIAACTERLRVKTKQLWLALGVWVLYNKTLNYRVCSQAGKERKTSAIFEFNFMNCW